MSWLYDTERQILWLHAPPGFGKSVTSAALVDHLKLEHPHVVLSHFCSATQDDLRKPTNILRSWIVQGLQQRIDLDLFNEADNLRRRGESRVATEKDLWLLLAIMAKSDASWILIMDGFDECHEFESDYHQRCGDSRGSFLERLRACLTDATTHLMVTSRCEDDIRDALCQQNQSAPKVLTCQIRQSDVQEDIVKFSTQQVNSFKLLRDDPDKLLQENITHDLSMQSGGMFLWVRLQSSQLAKARTVDLLKKQMTNLPPGLNEFYERDWARIQTGDEPDRKMMILRWVVFAVYPLTTRELLEAVAIEKDGFNFRLSKGSLPGRTVTDAIVNEWLIDPCKPFLTLHKDLDNRSGFLDTVQITHFSMSTFLQAKLKESLCCGSIYHDRTLASTCIGYLSTGLAWMELDIPDKALETHPLLDYAMTEWMNHIDTNHVDFHDARIMVNEFFSPENMYWSKWRDAFHAHLEETAPLHLTIDRVFTPENQGTRCYYAAQMGLLDTLRDILERDENEINTTGGRFGTALQAACSRGHLEAVKLLLDSGAEVNVRTGFYGCALNAAASNGHADIVSALLQNGAELSITDDVGGFALASSARQGHYEVVKQLVHHKAHLNQKTDRGSTALVYATSNGHTDVVKLLMKAGASLEDGSQDGWTPLISAAHQSHAAIVKMLLKAGVKSDTTDEYGWTPLHVVAQKGDAAMVKLLLEAMAKSEAAAQDGCTPLHLAAEKDHVATVKALLEARANSEVTDQDGHTPLYIAARQGHAATVKVLLEAEAKIEAADQHGRTPLYAAAGQGHTSMAKLLLEAGAEIEAADQQGWTPLQIATSRGHTTVVKLLLEARAATETVGSDGWTPLRAAADLGHTAIAKLLLEAGTNIDALCQESGTSLYAACLQGHTAIVELLLNAECDPVKGSDSAFMPLWAASSGGHSRIVELLLKTKACLDVQSDDFEAVLQAASEGGHERVVQMLLANDNSVPPSTYASAIWAASKGGYEKVVQMLLAHGASANVLPGKFGGALRVASKGGYEKVVQMLLTNGASIHIPINTYLDAIWAASAGGHEKVLQMLLAHGASVDVLPSKFGGALRAASEGGHEKVVQMLLTNGANVNKKGGIYGHALQAASQGGHEKTVQLLLANGAHVNGSGGIYGNALRAAYVEGHDNVVQMLLNAGAANGRDDSDGLGRSRIHFAAMANSCDAIEVALALGSDVNLLDNHQWTPLHWGAYFGNVEATQFLQQHGADVTLRDWRDMTPSQVAILADYDDVAAHLSISNNTEAGSEVATSSAIKIRAWCDSCGHDLIETQYHCDVCPGYDLCFRCIRDAHKIHPDHTFGSTFRYATQ